MNETDMATVAEVMVDRSGDDRWEMVAVVDLYKWFGSFDTVTEACDYAEASSITLDLFF